jgi:hypothetical protein
MRRTELDVECHAYLVAHRITVAHQMGDHRRRCSETKVRRRLGQYVGIRRAACAVQRDSDSYYPVDLITKSIGRIVLFEIRPTDYSRFVSFRCSRSSGGSACQRSCRRRLRGMNRLNIAGITARQGRNHNYRHADRAVSHCRPCEVRSSPGTAVDEPIESTTGPAWRRSRNRPTRHGSDPGTHRGRGAGRRSIYSRCSSWSSNSLRTFSAASMRSSGTSN